VGNRQVKPTTGDYLYLDEIALKKGHSTFETVIYSEDAVLETLSGKKSVDLQVLLATIPGIGQVKQVCMDMCASFAAAVRKALPQAEIVLDRFHLVKLLNEKLDTLRKRTHRSLDKRLSKRFSHIRFILFKDYKRLHRDERRLLKEYLRLNGEMKTIYWQSQSFRRILFGSQGKSRAEISNTLMHWTDSVRKTLGRFVKNLESWWDETVNACLFPLNNGRAEGVNNKIKLLKRQGYGFRNRLNFKCRIQAALNP
jgi:transposase